MRRFELASLTPAETVLLGADSGKAAAGAASLEEAADAIVTYLHAALWDSSSDRPATALVRFYRTISYGELEIPLREVAAALSDRPSGLPRPSMKCLTLMGTAGLEASWNSRQTSERHRVIPLPSTVAIRRLPMVARLVHDMGVPVDSLVGAAPEGFVDSAAGRTSLLHIEHAEGDAHVPDQESFVQPYGIRSVAGFGGRLGAADLWAVILFCRVPVSREVARLIRMLGTDVKMAILPVLTNRFFAA